MAHILMPQIDLAALDTRTLYTQCFEIFKKDVIQEGFSIELETRILEILKALQDLYSNRDDITDILAYAPKDSESVEHIIVNSMFDLANDALNQWDQIQQTKIAEQPASNVTIAIDTLESTEEDDYERISIQEATDILFSRVYKKVSRQRHNISNIELKVLFIQFYFANSQDRLAILSELTDPQEKYDFIIAAKDVMKKFLDINPTLTRSEVDDLHKNNSVNERKKKNGGGSGHAMNHLKVPNLDDPTSSHSFKLYMTAQSSSTNEKIYLSKVLINFAKKVKELHNITTSLPCSTLEHPSTTSKASSSCTNIKDLNLMVITFLENIMKKYKFNKFKK